MNICVIGTGYVGLVTGASLAYLNNDVICVDVDESKISKLKEGEAPFYEPGIKDLIEHGQSTARLSFTTNLQEAMLSSEVIYIAVGTPPLPDGSPDLTYVKKVAQSISRGIVANHRLGNFRIIINKSTVPVGSGNWVDMLVREQIRNLVKTSVVEGIGQAGGDLSVQVRRLVDEISSTFTVVSNPEFLREGTALHDTFYPDRIVIGANHDRAVEILKELYAPLLEQSFEAPTFIGPRPAGLSSVPLVVTDLASAEMIKYAANAFLALKISFANEIANICEETGADVTKVTHGIGLDQRIGARFLNAGAGWGGSCFGKDVSALIQIANEYGYFPELLDAARSVNQRQRRLIVKKLQNSLKIIKGKTIGLLGLSFKPDTDDVRDAPSYSIASDLLKMGACVKAYDPVAIPSFRKQHPELEMIYATGIDDLALDCDALVIVTEWKEFKNLNLPVLRRLMSGSLLIDGRNVVDQEAAVDAGLRYIGVGKGGC